MNSFFKPHIEMLVREGNQVDIACNYKELELDSLYSELGCGFHQVDFSRSPFSADNIRAYGQLKRVIEEGRYDIVHCHTPNASVITRLVCRGFGKRDGLKVFYTAHGFHFYKGAPKLNWMIFYPIEKLCSLFTDKLITINKEDYELAKRNFHSKEILYVPGVGVDISRFKITSADKEAKRREIGVPEDATLLLSVGELNENKNHQIIINALSKLDNPDIHYVIAGVGEKKDFLLKLAEDCGLGDRLHLIGYRRDIPELISSSDVFCFPSYREGLSVSLMEAMAAGLPCVVSRIRGNTDLIDREGGCHFNPYDVEECSQALRRITEIDLTAMKRHNLEKIQGFSKETVLDDMKIIYGI